MIKNLLALDIFLLIIIIIIIWGRFFAAVAWAGAALKLAYLRLSMTTLIDLLPTFQGVKCLLVSVARVVIGLPLKVVVVFNCLGSLSNAFFFF